MAVSLSKSGSRRQLLKSGLAVIGLEAAAGIRLNAASRGRRSVVCIYMLGGNDSAAMLASGASAASPGFHPALEEVRALFDSRVLAVVANVGDSASGPDGPRRRFDPALAYLPQGYLTLSWAAGMAGSGLKTAAFTQFPNLLAAGSRANTSLLVPGGVSSDQVLAALNQDTLRTEFPDTSLGRQLQQVARVLASGLTGGIYVCPMAAPPVFGNPAARETTRLRELSSAMAAFHSSTLSLGVANSVTTFTASEIHPAATARGGGYEFALGGAVAGGDVFGNTDGLTPGASRERYLATVAHWFGMPRMELKNHFRGWDGAGSPTLSFLL